MARSEHSCSSVTRHLPRSSQRSQRGTRHPWPSRPLVRWVSHLLRSAQLDRCATTTSVTLPRPPRPSSQRRKPSQPLRVETGSAAPPTPSAPARLAYIHPSFVRELL